MARHQGRGRSVPALLTMHFALPRRRLAAALLCLVCAAGVARAQDPRVTAAQVAAREWLAFVDRGDAQTSWGAASKKFQAAISVTGWADALKKAQAPIGRGSGRARG